MGSKNEKMRERMKKEWMKIIEKRKNAKNKSKREK